MKILMVATNYNAPVGGGGQKSLKVLAESLIDAGHSVSVAALAHGKPGVSEVNGVAVHYLPIRNLYRPTDADRPATIARFAWHALDMFNPLAARDFKSVCQEERPDIVHSHVISGLSVSVWNAARSLGLPVVHTLRDQYLLCPRSTMFKGERPCAGQCGDCKAMRLPHRRLSNQLTGVIGVSDFILDRHIQSGFFTNVPVRSVVFNARDPDTIGLDRKSAFSKDPAHPLRFGFIGSIAPNKGIEYLLQTFKTAAPSATELWIAGTGVKAYQDYLMQEYTSSRVHFLGRVAPRDFYPQVDVVVVPSLWHEPLGMVVAEAFAFGKPVIGSRRGGIPEMIRHGENGFLFDPEQPDELARLIALVAADPFGFEKMGAVARESASPFFDTARYVKEHVAIYEEAIKIRDPSASLSARTRSALERRR